jgi:hypothetical protein
MHIGSGAKEQLHRARLTSLARIRKWARVRGEPRLLDEQSAHCRQVTSSGCFAKGLGSPVESVELVSRGHDSYLRSLSCHYIRTASGASALEVWRHA